MRIIKQAASMYAQIPRASMACLAHLPIQPLFVLRLQTERSLRDSCSCPSQLSKHPPAGRVAAVGIFRSLCQSQGPTIRPAGMLGTVR